jgi:hypothetical protein
MVSNKKSLSEEQIFADIMEMISSSNKKSKNVKSSSENKKKTKNVKNSSSKSKKNLRGGFAPIDAEGVMDDSNLAPVEAFLESRSNQSGMEGIKVGPNGVSGYMNTTGGIMPPQMPSMTMSGGKKKRRVVKKSGVKKAVKKVATKKRVVKKVGAKKVKKVGTKKRVAKKSGAKKVKKVAKKSKRVAKK